MENEYIRDFPERRFQPGSRWIFPTALRHVFGWIWQESARKIPASSGLEYCFHVPVYFRCVPVEYTGNTSDTVGTGPYDFTWAGKSGFSHLIRRN